MLALFSYYASSILGGCDEGRSTVIYVWSGPLCVVFKVFKSRPVCRHQLDCAISMILLGWFP